LHERLGHRIPVEELDTDDGRVVIVHVPSRLPGTAWHHSGRYLKRAGEQLASMTDAELKRGRTSQAKSALAPRLGTCPTRLSRSFVIDGRGRLGMIAVLHGQWKRRSPTRNCW
jgi:hypothetical protein